MAIFDAGGARCCILSFSKLKESAKHNSPLASPEYKFLMDLSFLLFKLLKIPITGRARRVITSALPDIVHILTDVSEHRLFLGGVYSREGVAGAAY
jgi:hypothetical protein